MNLDTYYSKKIKLYKPSQIREEKILELIPDTIENKIILDIGCADGTFGKVLKSKKAKVYGLDISSMAIKQAKKVLDKSFLIDINSQKLPLAANSVDIIIASEVIEHLQNPANLLKESFRVLKKEGQLIITTPNLLYWGNRIKFLKGQFQYEKSGVFDESHVHFYIYSTLLKDLEKNKFKITKENHVFPGSKVFSGIKSLFPGIFAYQLVVLCEKE